VFVIVVAIVCVRACVRACVRVCVKSGRGGDATTATTTGFHFPDAAPPGLLFSIPSLLLLTQAYIPKNSEIRKMSKASKATPSRKSRVSSHLGLLFSRLDPASSIPSTPLDDESCVESPLCEISDDCARTPFEHFEDSKLEMSSKCQNGVVVDEPFLLDDVWHLQVMLDDGNCVAVRPDVLAKRERFEAKERETIPGDFHLGLISKAKEKCFVIDDIEEHSWASKNIDPKLYLPSSIFFSFFLGRRFFRPWPSFIFLCAFLPFSLPSLNFHP
jgi:hypothetical protein